MKEQLDEEKYGISGTKQRKHVLYHLCGLTVPQPIEIQQMLNLEQKHGGAGFKHVTFPVPAGPSVGPLQGTWWRHLTQSQLGSTGVKYDDSVEVELSLLGQFQFLP